MKPARLPGRMVDAPGNHVDEAHVLHGHIPDDRQVHQALRRGVQNLLLRFEGDGIHILQQRFPQVF